MNKVLSMKIKFGFLISLVLGFLACFSTLKAESAPKRVVVAVTQIVEHPALDATRKGIYDVLKDSAYDLDWHFESAQGNASLASQIAQKFVGQKPDVIVALSTISSQAFLKYLSKNQDIPMVFSSVTDPLSAMIVNDLKRPGGAVTGVSNFIDLKPQFELFKEILPSLKKVGVVYNPGEQNSVVFIELAKKVAKKLGIKIVTVSAYKSSEVGAAAQSLADKVDAFFVYNDSTVLSAFESLLKVADLSGVPVFCSDVDMIERGAVAALGPDQYELGKQTGRMILAILEGQSPGEIAVGYPEKIELALNQKQAQKINLTFSPSLLKKASKVIE
jgi:putative ABC transport system substrate-binding protein